MRSPTHSASAKGPTLAPLAALAIAGVLGALVCACWSPASGHLEVVARAVPWRVVGYIAAALLTAVAPRACGLGKVVKHVVMRLMPHSLWLDACLKRAGKKAGIRDPRVLLDKGTLAAAEEVLRCFRDEAGLTQQGCVIAHSMVTDGLATVLTMINDRDTAAGKAILQGNIERPVFIAGPNRSGTTYLHRLLAQHDDFVGPRYFELTGCPVRPQGLSQFEHDKQRLKAAKGMLSLMDMLMPEVQFLHEFGLEEVEEDTSPGLAFQSSYCYPCFFEVPSFTNWLGTEAASAGHQAAYSLHRNFMQHLQFQAKQREIEGGLGGGGGGGGGGRPRPGETPLSAPPAGGAAASVASAAERERRWMNKSPFHMLTLEHLFAEYPDAMVVQTHRPTRDIIVSWFHLITVEHEGWLGRPLTEAERHRKIGRDHLAFIKGMVDAAMRFRRENPALASQFVDVRFEDFVSKPLETARLVYAALGVEVPPAGGEVDKRLRACRDAQSSRVKENLARRSSWKLEDFGVTEAEMAEAFGPYEDWAKGLRVVGPSGEGSGSSDGR